MRSIFWRIEVMRKFGTFDIPFTGLKLGTHRFQFDIDRLFFDQFELSEISNANIHATVDLEKQSNMMILRIELKGEVEVMCDRCGEDFYLPITSNERVIVKFGDEEIEQSDEIWVIPHHEHQLNVAELLYEFSNLALPIRKVHPEGECNEQALEKLSDLEHHDDLKVDPRWENLKNIKKDLK